MFRSFAVHRFIFLLSLFVPESVSLTSKRFERRGCERLQCGRLSNGRIPSPLKATAANENEYRATAPQSCLSEENIADEEEKFKISTCMSTACSKKRKSLGMDSLSTFGAMYSRASSSRVQVQEGPCVGSCNKAPCVSIEHEDFFGNVALEGMTADEFSADAFLNIITEEDADRVWSSVENAVKVMAEAEDEEED
mmetsp:Transcript_29975/g.64196  ORF Transcript_29975/g.64196 Transcript_29975/m.64196 type:complete len:195 (-) Transcript_29975:377-961(-)